MLSFSWDSAYESTPGTGLSRGSIDDTIRQMSRGIRQRMEREHNFGYDTEADDGTHRPGKTTVALRDSEAVRLALANMQDGAVYVQIESGVLTLYVYIEGTGWTALSTNAHHDLEGLSDDDHEQYWLLTEGIDDPTVSLDMGGNLLSIPGSITGALKVEDHVDVTNPHPVTTGDAIKADDLPKRIITEPGVLISDSGTLSVGEEKKIPNIVVPVGWDYSGVTAIDLFADASVFLGIITDPAEPCPNWGLYNSDSVSHTYELTIRGSYGPP